MTLYIKDNMILENCIALNKYKTNINVANFNTHHDFRNRNIIL